MKHIPYSCLIGLILIFLFTYSDSFALSDTLKLRGKLVSKEDQSPLIGATVMLINIKDSTNSKYFSADLEGRFRFEGLQKAFYKLKITSIGYKPFQKILRIQLPDLDLGVLALEEDIIALKEVKVEEQFTPVQQKGDTTQYNAAAFKTNPDANSADLVKKMPGIVVDKDGVTANGETVEQVLLDGKRFFGQDPLLSLNTIPAEIVDQVLVYDEQSEQSKLTGFDDGNTIKTMDIITKSGKQNGQFGNVYAGLGDRGLYKAGGSINMFKEDRRITLLGMTNNINQQNFGEEDLIGLGGNGGRGGFRRGGGSSFINGEQDGITQTHSFGINFTDQWTKKLNVEGNYFMNRTDNNQSESMKRETYLKSRNQLYEEQQSTNTINDNHRLNLRMDYAINENNNILFRSNVSFQERSTLELTNGSTFFEGDTLISLTDNQYESNSESFNVNNNLTLQHKFKKIGRTVALDVNQQIRPSDQEISFKDLIQDSLLDYLTSSTNQQYTSSIVYTEPIGSLAQLSAKYEVKMAFRDSKTDVFGVDDENQRLSVDGLSNHFNSDYTYHEPSISYAYHKMGSHFNVELAYQEAYLDNQSTLFEQQSTNNKYLAVLPSVNARFELSSKTRFFARYSSNTTEPTISQLQNVMNNTNPLFITLGNPNLDQTYTHNLRMGVRYTNSEKNLSFSNFSNVQNSYDYIGDDVTTLRADSLINSVLVQRGTQLARPTNLDGYWSVQNNSTFGIAIPKIKNNFNVSLNLRYTHIPGSIEGLLNYSNTYSTAFRFGLSSNISEKIDYTVYYEFDGSLISNSLQEVSDRYYTQTFATELDLMLAKGFIWRNEINFQRYTASNSAFNTTYTLWNMGLAKKFLKNNLGELELSVFDLLGQNQSFSQSINSSYLEEVQTEVLQRYFMVTFTYQFRHFK